MALNDVPLPTQSLAATQVPIRQNFSTYIGPQYAIDHQAFNSASNNGYHLKVTLVPPADSTIPAAATNGWVVFPAIPDTAFNVVGVATYPFTLATQELNIRKDGSIPVIPFTAKDAVNEGWSYLPSGILLKWGSRGVAPAVGGSANTTGADRQVTFPVGANIPVYTTLLQVLITPRSPGTPGGTYTRNPAMFAHNFTPTNFQVNVGGSAGGTTIAFTYLAIGI